MNQPTAPEMRRPYAPTSNVIAVIQRGRSRNLPDRVDDDFLNLAGVNTTGSIGRRVSFALRFLGLIADDGKPTDTLRAISAASDGEYRELLTAAIRNAYAEDFERVDPAQDTQAQMIDAFRRYEPRSQTDRMVMLFLGLCREAGIPVQDAPRRRAMQPPPPREVPRPAPRPASRPSLRQSTRPQQAHSAPAGPGTQVFGITESDIAVLDESEFDQVWAALGKVARARARARTANGASEQRPSVSEDQDDGSED